MNEINFDAMTREEIYGFITLGIISNEEVTAYYGNEWWDETPVSGGEHDRTTSSRDN